MTVHGALAATAALLLLPSWAPAAPPQTVYRCGPEGRSYSQTPCADGKALSVDDPRSASQQKAAQDVAERDAARAQKLREERQQREAAAQTQPGGFHTAPVARAASAPAPKPGSSKKKSKAAADPNSTPILLPASAPAKR